MAFLRPIKQAGISLPITEANVSNLVRDLATKAAKPGSFTAGNVAALDSGGNLTDAGATLASKANATTVTTLSNSLSAHLADHTNPHATTAAQVGAYTTTQTDTLLAGYLPLTGGTLTGNLVLPYLGNLYFGTVGDPYGLRLNRGGSDTLQIQSGDGSSLGDIWARSIDLTGHLAGGAGQVYVGNNLGIGANTQIKFAADYYGDGRAGYVAGLALDSTGVVKVTDGGTGLGSLSAAKLTLSGNAFILNSDPTGSGQVALYTNGAQRLNVYAGGTRIDGFTQYQLTPPGGTPQTTPVVGFGLASTGVAKITDGGTGLGGLLAGTVTLGSGAATMFSNLNGGILWGVQYGNNNRLTVNYDGSGDNHYCTGTSAGSHIFYLGQANGASTEAFRIDANGQATVGGNNAINVNIVNANYLSNRDGAGPGYSLSRDSGLTIYGGLSIGFATGRVNQYHAPDTTITSPSAGVLTVQSSTTGCTTAITMRDRTYTFGDGLTRGLTMNGGIDAADHIRIGATDGFCWSDTSTPASGCDTSVYRASAGVVAIGTSYASGLGSLNAGEATFSGDVTTTGGSFIGNGSGLTSLPVPTLASVLAAGNTAYTPIVLGDTYVLTLDPTIGVGVSFGTTGNWAPFATGDTTINGTLNVTGQTTLAPDTWLHSGNIDRVYFQTNGPTFFNLPSGQQYIWRADGYTNRMTLDTSGNLWVDGNGTFGSLTASGATSLDGGEVFTDGNGNLAAGSLKAYSGLTVSGPTSLDLGAITTDGNGSLEVNQSLDVGGGNFSVAGTVVTTWHSTLDDGAGNMTVAGSLSASALTVGNAAAVPTDSVSSGQVGQVVYDSDYLYICTATNFWKRVSLSTFGGI